VKIFAGIDGGQSSTVALIGDERGEVLGRGVGGPADEVAQGEGSTRQRDALQGALAQALQAAGLPADARFERVVAGISGYDGKTYGAAPQFRAREVRLLHDAPIAHAAAFDGGDGIIAIAGTGSVVYGRCGADELTIGGWGYLFGDEGGAFWMASEALRAMMALQDEGRSDELFDDVFAAFSSDSLRAVARAFYHGAISRGDLAAFAERLIELAPKHDTAREIVLGGAVALVSDALLCAKRLRLKHPRAAFVGGLLHSHFFSSAIDAALAEAAPALRRTQPAGEPAAGALLLAVRG
jgi:N-acetylglucosamine kinase-like BadF-type ATPase